MESREIGINLYFEKRQNVVTLPRIPERAIIGLLCSMWDARNITVCMQYRVFRYLNSTHVKVMDTGYKLYIY